MCRFVVTQNRHAVNVQNPVVLTKYLEALVGTSPFETALSEVNDQISCNNQRLDELQDQIYE